MPGFVSETSSNTAFRPITRGVSSMYGIAVFGFSYYGTIPDVETGYFLPDTNSATPGFVAEP